MSSTELTARLADSASEARAAYDRFLFESDETALAARRREAEAAREAFRDLLRRSWPALYIAKYLPDYFASNKGDRDDG